ncbi:unnamed protein product [Camellia sinensis]
MTQLSSISTSSTILITTLMSDQRRPLLFDEPRTPEVLPFRSGSEDLILTKDLRKSSKFSLSSTLYCIAVFGMTLDYMPGVLCGGLIRVTRLDILVGVVTAQHVNDAEIALQGAEKDVSVSYVDCAETIVQQSEDELVEEGKLIQGNSGGGVIEREIDSFEEPKSLSSDSDQENGKISLESSKDTEIDSEKSKNMVQTKKQDLQKDLTREGSPFNAPKMGLSSHQQSLFHGLIESARKQLPKLVVGSLLIGAGIAFYTNRVERINQLFLQPDIITAGIDEVSSNTKPLIRQVRKLPKRVKKLMEVNEEEASLFDMSWLLFASVIYVPIFQKNPWRGLAWLLQKDGSPVLGYLTAVILIGPYGLSIIHHVHETKAIAEFEVVFLMFNIGLELSVERLSSMKKYVFGLGSAQVLVTAVVVGLVSRFIAGQPSPAAIIIGDGLALSSTAVVLQVTVNEQLCKYCRNEVRACHAMDELHFLFCFPVSSDTDLAVGFQAIAEPLGLAAVKAIVAITAIIAGGHLPLWPIYKQVAENQNAEIFSANRLLVILGTSLLTARTGLSMTLGAFLVGMSIDPKLFVSNFPVIMGTLPLLIGGKTILVAVAGRLFGISIISAIRVGLLLAPGREFAFVAFGEAVNQRNCQRQVLGQKKNYLRGFGIGPQPSSTFDAAARARDQQMDAMRAEMEALHEERQRDHEELMRDREEGKRDHEEMMREREGLMKQAEDGKKAREAQVQLNHLNNMVSRLTSLLQP